MNSLDPIDFKSDEKFDPRSEVKEINFQGCKHKGVAYDKKGELRCPCGAAWSGPQLHELYKLLTNQK